MDIIKAAVLTSAFISLFACRARPESSATRAVETTSFKGRVAIFDIYDKDKRLTRQAPGILVSARAVLMPGLKADETVVLADAQRKGEKYIPLPAAEGNVAFIGLEAEAPQAQGLVPTTANPLQPYLSSQVLAPIDLRPSLQEWTKVIMFNEYGYVEAMATYGEPGKVMVAKVGHPQRYVDGSITSSLLYYFLPQSRWNPLRSLSTEDSLKMLRKGGAIIATGQKYDRIVSVTGGWGFTYNNLEKVATVDIISFLSESLDYADDIAADQLFPAFYGFTRDEMFNPALKLAVESVSLKMNIPQALEQEILKYLVCNPSG